MRKQAGLGEWMARGGARVGGLVGRAGSALMHPVANAAGNVVKGGTRLLGRATVGGAVRMFKDPAVAAGMIPVGVIAASQAAAGSADTIARNYRTSRNIQKGLMEVPLHPSEAPGLAGITGIFSKTSSASTPMDDIYVALSQGRLSQNDVTALEEFSDALHGGQVVLEQSKEATNPMFNAAAAMAGTIGAGALAHGMLRGGKALVEDLSLGRDLDAVLRAYPDLKDYPRHQLEMLYASLRRINPKYAKDPVIAGSYLTRMMEARSSFDNPRAMPAIDLDVFKNIAQAGQFISQQKNDGRMGDIFHNAADRGMDALLAGVGPGRKGR